MNTLAATKNSTSKFKCHGLFYFTSPQNVILEIKMVYEMVKVCHLLLVFK